jgi:hypothetical protein
MYNLKTCNIENSVYSDHNPITIELYIENETIRGKGIWKFYNSLLTDAEFVTKVKNKIHEYSDRYKNHKDHCLIWDTAKSEIRGIAISHATYKTCIRKEYERTLQCEMTNCENIIAISPNTDILQQYVTIKKELEEINNHIAKGVFIRAKAKHIEQNEANTKLFLGLERSKANLKNITKLIVDDNNEITNATEILKQGKCFYENLYLEKLARSCGSKKILPGQTKYANHRKRPKVTRSGH